MCNSTLLIIPPVAYIGYPTLECATLFAILSKKAIKIKVIELNLTLLRYFFKTHGDEVKSSLEKVYESEPYFNTIYLNKIAKILDFETNHKYLESLALTDEFEDIIMEELEFKEVKKVFLVLEYMRVSSLAYKSLLKVCQLIKKKFSDADVILTGSLINIINQAQRQRNISH